MKKCIIAVLCFFGVKSNVHSQQTSFFVNGLWYDLTAVNFTVTPFDSTVVNRRGNAAGLDSQFNYKANSGLTFQGLVAPRRFVQQSKISGASFVDSAFALTINGTTQTLGGNGKTFSVTAAASVGTPVTGIAITSGTAFQPNANSACNILVSGTLTGGIAGVSGTTVIALSPTSGGTYTNIGNGISYILSALALVDNRDGATFFVPKGWYVRVTNTAVGLGAGVTTTYTRWDF